MVTQKPKVRYRVCTGLSLVPVLSEINLIHALSSYFVRSVFTLSSYLRTDFEVVFSLKVFRLELRKIFCLSHVCCMPHPSHPPLFVHNSNLTKTVNYEAPHNAVFSNFVFSTMFGANTVVSTVFPNTTSLCSSLYFYRPGFTPTQNKAGRNFACYSLNGYKLRK